MDFSDKHEKLIEGATGVLAGFLAWEYQSTQKWAYWQSGGMAGAPPGVGPRTGYSLFSMARLQDALAGILGNGAVRRIFPGWGGAAAFRPAPLGFLNSTTFTGVALAVLDTLAQESKQYRGLPAVHSLVSGTAWGLIIGGAVGGIFDPRPPSGAVTPPTGAPSGPGSPSVYAAAAAAHNARL